MSGGKKFCNIFAKGFGTSAQEINVHEKIALIHSEVTEAYEAYRRNNHNGSDGFATELGDIIQRVLHLAGSLDIDIEDAIIQKLKTNENRKWDWDKLNETNVKPDHTAID
jgi:NTP pyrophosphatase (non-canonical NTP hydrolase)